MYLDLGLFESYTGTRHPVTTGRARNLQTATGAHGYESLSFEVPLGLLEAFRLYDFPGVLYARLFCAGSAWEGRVEDIELITDGVKITALGYWRALFDLDKSYTALWSETELSRWTVAGTELFANRPSARYDFDTRNRLYISPEKGAIFQTGTDLGSLILRELHTSSRQVNGCQFSYTVLLPVDWQARVLRYNAALTVANVIWNIVGTGALQTGAIHATFTADDVLEFDIFNNSGVAYTVAAESGDWYAILEDWRVVSSTTNRVNTTVAAGIAAGTRTVTPASMSRIYVGQQLVIDSGAAVGEVVTVTAITATTFTAVYVNAHGAAFTVQGHVIYADEIVSHLISQVSALNSGQLSSSTALIASPGLDLLDEIYEDQTPADILTYLAELGDNASPPNRWEVGVFEGQRLYFRIRGSAAQQWYVDVADVPQVQRTLELLFNSVYGIYEEASGRTLRTAASTNTDSVSRYGITRRTSVKVDTTLAAQAQFVRDTTLADTKDITPRAGIVVTSVYTASGARVPLWMVRSGDRVTIRNLPPVLSTSIDKIRTFNVYETAHSVDDKTLEITPEAPRPTVDFLLARQAKGF